MSLKDTTKELRELLHDIARDLEKADGGNKAASQRVRTGTVKLEKVSKVYRKQSISSEKTSTGKKPRAAAKPAAKKAKTHHTPSSTKGKAKPAAKPAAKSAAKPAAKKTAASARPLAVRRPTAKHSSRKA
jgi:hypothetical protein